MPRPERFLPSRDAFGFTNSWPKQPAVVRDTPFGRISLGDASGGLCGGMVFAVLDYWHQGVTPPGTRPDLGEPLYDYVVNRLVDSWHLPGGILQYYRWMTCPDGDGSWLGLKRVRGLAWQTIKGQWPAIAETLDDRVPVPLGVVTVASRKHTDLSANHQVLAYAYATNGSTVTVSAYDPNRGGRDDIEISFDTSAPTKRTEFRRNLGIGARPVRGFFRVPYAPKKPPGR